jgi:hypothetical protein
MVGRIHGIVLTSALKCISAGPTSDRYIGQMVLQPKTPIGKYAPDATTDPLSSSEKSKRKLQKSYKNSKSSKSEKSTKQEIYYVIVHPPPPTSQSSSWLGTNTNADN